MDSLLERYTPGEELKKALEQQNLKGLLVGKMGAFPVRYLFINRYINYIGFVMTNPDYSPENESRLSGYNLKEPMKVFVESLKMKSEKPVDILFISRNRTVSMKTHAGYITGDYIFYSIIDKIQKNFPEFKIKMYISDDAYNKYKYLNPLDILRSAYNTIKILIIWSIYKRSIIKDLSAFNSHHIIDGATNFFKFRPLMRDALMGYSVKNMFAILKPKLVISNDDCLYIKPMNASFLKFIVLQSARLIEDLEEIRSLIFQEPDLLPDYYLSSGKSFGKIKSRWNVAKEVIVTGLPRYDVLYYSNLIYSKHDFLKRYNINPDHKIVLWTTQCHAFSDDENASNFCVVFSAIKDLKGTTLIIKQHPAESEAYTIAIKNYISKYTIDAVVAPKDTDTYEMISVCDLLITRDSTTAIEAIALDKPVIILNMSGEPDKVEYVDEGVALGVYNGDNLKNAIDKLLLNDAELAVNRKMYVENYLHKVDGKATERVMDLILANLLHKNELKIEDLKQN